jgi:UDP-glucuronate 4-epimerase
MKFIETIEKYTGKKATKNFMDIQKGDVPATFADVDDLMKDVGFRPDTSIEDGVKAFIDWYREFYGMA